MKQTDGVCFFPVHSLDALYRFRSRRRTKTPLEVSGAALKDVDVKLSRYGGAQFSSGGMSSLRAKTNEKGEWSFGKVPAGKYDLTISLPNVVADPAAPASTQKMHTSTETLNNRITIEGVQGGPIKKDLDFKQIPAPDAKLRPGRPKFGDITVTIEVDGKGDVKGTINARAVNNPGVK